MNITNLIIPKTQIKQILMYMFLGSISGVVGMSLAGIILGGLDTVACIRIGTGFIVTAVIIIFLSRLSPKKNTQSEDN